MCLCVFTRASLFVLGLVILCLVYFHCLIISSSAIDCLEIPLSGMTYYVRSGTLNPTHSLIHCWFLSCSVRLHCIELCRWVAESLVAAWSRDNDTVWSFTESERM